MVVKVKEVGKGENCCEGERERGGRKLLSMWRRNGRKIMVVKGRENFFVLVEAEVGGSLALTTPINA